MILSATTATNWDIKAKVENPKVWLKIWSYLSKMALIEWVRNWFEYSHLVLNSMFTAIIYNVLFMCLGYFLMRKNWEHMLVSVISLIVRLSTTADTAPVEVSKSLCSVIFPSHSSVALNSITALLPFQFRVAVIYVIMLWRPRTYK